MRQYLPSFILKIYYCLNTYFHDTYGPPYNTAMFILTVIMFLIITLLLYVFTVILWSDYRSQDKLEAGATEDIISHYSYLKIAEKVHH